MFIFLYRTLDVPPQPSQKFSDAGCCQGEVGRPSPSRRNRWYLRRAEGRPGTTHRDQTHRAGFRGFNPTLSGENSLQKRVSSPAAARRPKPKARRPLPILCPGPLSRPRATRSGAAGPGGGRGAECVCGGVLPAPPPQAGGRPRTRNRPEVRPLPAGAPPAAGFRAAPTPLGPRRAHRTGRSRPSTARAPLSAPAPAAQPNGFRDAGGGAGRGWLGFPHLPRRECPRSHLRVTPLRGGGRRLPWRLVFGY